MIVCVKIGCTECPRGKCPGCGIVDCETVVDPLCWRCDAREERANRPQRELVQSDAWGSVELLGEAPKQARKRGRAA